MPPKWWSLGYLLFGRPCYEVQFIRKINVLWSSWGLLGVLEALTKWCGRFFFFYNFHRHTSLWLWSRTVNKAAIQLFFFFWRILLRRHFCKDSCVRRMKGRQARTYPQKQFNQPKINKNSFFVCAARGFLNYSEVLRLRFGSMFLVCCVCCVCIYINLVIFAAGCKTSCPFYG